MRAGPFLPSIQAFFPGNGHEGKENSSQGTAGDVARGEEDAVALVTFGDELILSQRRAGMFPPGVSIYEPTDHAADVNRGGGGNGKVNSDREGERGNARKLEHDR